MAPNATKEKIRTIPLGMGRKRVSPTPPERPELQGSNELIRFKKMLGWRIETLRWGRWPESSAPFAKMFGMTTQNIRLWERGESLPSVYELIRIAKIFGVTMDFLAYGDARALSPEKIEELVKLKLI